MTWTARSAVRAGLLGLALVCASAVRAFEPPVPTGYINDHAMMLSPAAQARLERRLSQFQAEVGPQFALLTVQSLEGLRVEDYALQTAQRWALGSAAKDDGLLLLLVKGDRRFRIEVGRGLEGVIPDLIAARIGREILTPGLKSGRYEYAIEAAFDALIVRAGGQHDPSFAALADRPAPADKAPRPTTTTTRPEEYVVQAALLGTVLMIWLALRIGRRKGLVVVKSRPAAPSGNDVTVRAGLFSGFTVRASTRSTSSSGSSGSSSFSGGGGTFGGGGASGSW
jgi:uncharacterized protein